MSTLGICKLCELEKELQLSHAIGDAVFKRIFKANSGKAIAITSGDNSIHYSSDSWAEYQLCSECELLLNNEYERYSLNTLRDHTNCIKKASCLTFTNVNQYKIMLYFLSIYYRAALSNHRAYQNVGIYGEHKNLIQQAILNNGHIEYNQLPVKISRLKDDTQNGFTNMGLKGMIPSPFCTGFQDTNTPLKACFVIEGFYIEIYLHGFKFKNRNDHGVLNPAKENLYIPFLDFFNVPELVHMVATGSGKYKSGNFTIKE
ncbi:MAG: hypothetical protein JKY76_04035 [Proteobacteria bacterium]|nr:hypothetical protein [Pseudomonadota bacterium]